MGFICEICGGTDIVKRNGAFVCEGCGVKYDVAELRAIVLGENASAPAAACASVSAVDAVPATTSSASAASPITTPKCPSRIGQRVTFGNFAQAEPAGLASDVSHESGAEPIEWTVIAEEDGLELLLCVHTLAARPYDAENAACTWESCDLRAWLNGWFLDAAFTEDEQERIVCRDVRNPDNAGYGTKGGAFTSDKVVLLSIDEAKRLLVSDDARLCRPTPRALADGAWTNEMGYARWWLRTPGFMQSMAAYVETTGAVLSQGIFVDNAGVSVRPVIWVRRL